MCTVARYYTIGVSFVFSIFIVCYCFFFFFCSHLCVLGSAVDSMLEPENRVHMSAEEQLRELLDKLDTVSSMRSSGARTRRVRLLCREIHNVRFRQGQPSARHTHNGEIKEEEEEEEDEELDEEEREKEGDQTLSGSDKGESFGSR